MLSKWGHWNPHEPRVADINMIEKRIRTLPKDALVRMGGLTDPLQPIEETERVTLKTIKLLNTYNLRYMVTTKSSLIAGPDYIAALNPDLAHIQVTVTALDDERAYTYEKASPPSERIKAIYALQDARIDVMLRLSPFTEEYMNVEQLNALRINKTLVEFLRVNAHIMVRFPGIDYSKYTVKQGGFRHLSLSEKFRLLKQIKLPNVSVAEYVPMHHKFWVRNQNPNKHDCCNLRCSKSSA
jgi:DNA repair photolyase